MTDDLRALLDGDDAPDELLGALMPALSAALDCDRCAVFLRDPASRLSRMTHVWQRRPEYALAREGRDWRVEAPTLAEDDPMFAVALRDPAALYIEDVLSADPALVNGPYEVEHFGHRALVHAPLYYDGEMYGILEPCVMGAPRVWSEADRVIVAEVQERVAPAAAAYVAANCP